MKEVKRPSTAARREALLDLVRTHDIRTQVQARDYLRDTYGALFDVSLVTMERDFASLGLVKDPKGGVYRPFEDRITRGDIYDDLRQILRSMVHDVHLHSNRSFIIIDVDAGVSARLAMMLEALRYEEAVTATKRSWFDEIAGVLDGGVTNNVLVIMKNAAAGEKFKKKLMVLRGRGGPEGLDFISDAEEKELLERTLRPEKQTRIMGGG